MTNRSPNPYRGILFGAIAGLTASWAMNRFQDFLSSIAEPRPERASGGHQEDATMKAADKIAHIAHFRPLSYDEKTVAGPVLHYVFGSAMGALYGLAAEYFPEARLGFGSVFGALIFALADETAIPLSGLSASPTEYPLSTHLRALASHVVYGASTEAVRSTLSRAA